MNTNEILQLADKAQACVTHGQWEEAKSLYQRLCHVDSKNEENWLMLAAVNGETGFIEDALKCANEAIALDKSYVEAYLTRAHLLQQLGKLKEALDSAIQAVEIDSEYAEAWLFLTGLAGQLQQYADAEKWAQATLNLLPDSAESFVNLGNARYQLGKYAEAETAYKQAIALQPDRFQSQLGHAKAVVAQERFEEGMELISPICARYPDNSDAACCLAICKLELGEEEGALQLLKQIIENEPGYLLAYHHIAKILEHRGDYEQAIYYLQQAKEKSDNPLEILGSLIKLYHESGAHSHAIDSCNEVLQNEPDNIEARYYKAIALSNATNYEEALIELEELASTTPDNPKIIAAQAGVLERMGNVDKTHKLILPFLKNDESTVPAEIINIYTKICHRFGECDNAIALMNELLTSDLDDNYRSALLFTLGRLHDKLGNYEPAFDCIHKANLLKPIRYNHAKTVRYTDRLISPDITSQLENKALQNTIKPAVTPVFIVGMPRSGTSLVEQIIASHPAAHGGGETQAITSISRDLVTYFGSEHPYPECISLLTPELVEKIREQYVAYTEGLPPDVSVVTDKMPQNYLHLALIRILFPDAPIIHCVRDPIDTCLSGYFQHFSGYHDYAYKLEDLGNYYREYQRLVQHYRDVVKIPLFEVKYEEIVSDTERVSREIIAYCGLSWDDRCLRYYESDRLVRTASYDQVRQPVYSESVNRWKHYEKHLGPLITALQG